MKRIPPSTQMREALMSQLEARPSSVPAGPAQPLRAFVARAAELILQVGIEEQLGAFLGRAPYERGGGARPGYRNGYGHHTLRTEAGPVMLRPPKVRGTRPRSASSSPRGSAPARPSCTPSSPGPTSGACRPGTSRGCTPRSSGAPSPRAP